MFHPDFDTECRICGTTPTVVVEGHVQPQTELCGICFWQDSSMFDWTIWNDREDEDEQE